METYKIYNPYFHIFPSVRKELLSERDGNADNDFKQIVSSFNLSGRNFSLKEMETYRL